MVLSKGGNKVAPHREVQEEEKPSGKKLASNKKRRRISRRSLPEGAGPSRGKTGKKKRHRKASNHGDGEYLQAEMVEVAPGEIPTRLVGRRNRKSRAPTSWAESAKRLDAPTGQRETELEGPPESEGALLGGISRP